MRKVYIVVRSVDGYAQPIKTEVEAVFNHKRKAIEHILATFVDKIVVVVSLFVHIDMDKILVDNTLLDITSLVDTSYYCYYHILFYSNLIGFTIDTGDTSECP